MKRYWNPAGAANWNDINSWSATDGGATGASVPTIDDDVFFTGTNVNNCTINTSPVMKSLTTSGYTGTLTQDATATRIFTVAESITSTGTLKIYGNSTTARLYLRHGTTNSVLTSFPGQGTLTINVAGIETAYVDFQDCIGAGTADWDLTKQATDSSGDCGGNVGITFTTAATQTWTNADGGNWNDAGNWSGRVPLPQDDCDLGIAFNDAKTITPNMFRLGKNIDFTGATWTTSLTFGSSLQIVYGSFVIETGMSITGNLSQVLILASNENSYLDLKTTPMGRPIGIGTRKKVTLLNNLTVTSTSISLRLYTGEFDTNGYSINFGSIQFFGGKIYLRDASHTLTGSLPISYTSGILDAGTSTVNFTYPGAADRLTIAGSLRYNNVLINRGTSTGIIEITGSNIFNEFKDIGTSAHSIFFVPGTTQTFNKFTVNGSAGNLITINSGSGGVASTSRHYLVKSSRGENVCNYLNIQHSIARPSKTWFASNSTNNQSTDDSGDGWIFKLRGKRIMHNAIVK